MQVIKEQEQKEELIKRTEQSNGMKVPLSLRPGNEVAHVSGCVKVKVQNVGDLCQYLIRNCSDFFFFTL